MFSVTMPSWIEVIAARVYMTVYYSEYYLCWVNYPKKSHARLLIESFLMKKLHNGMAVWGSVMKFSCEGV